MNLGVWQFALRPSGRAGQRGLIVIISGRGEKNKALSPIRSLWVMAQDEYADVT